MSLGFKPLRRRFERLLATFSVVAVLMSMMVVFAPAALAHHANLTGSVACSEGGVATISYTASTWTSTNDGGRYNSNIGVYLDLESGTGFDGDENKIGSGMFLPGVSNLPVTVNVTYITPEFTNQVTQSPSGQFSGTFNASAYAGQTIYLKSRADDKWWNNTAAGSVGESDDVIQLQIPVCTRSVTVTPSVQACRLNNGVPLGAVSFVINPASGATVVVNGTGGPYNFSGSGGSQALAPGPYSWLATAATGFQLSGSSSGNFTVLPCGASTVVVGGECAIGPNGAPLGQVQVTIDPTSGATVIVSGPGGSYNFSGAGGSQALAPGPYTWTATAASGFSLTGPATGAFTIEPCTGSVSVSSGACSLIDGPLGPVDVTIDPDAAATVTVYSDAAMTDEVASFDGDGGSTNLPPGTYYWAAEPESGFELEGLTEGQFTIEPCDASTVVVSGGCSLNQAGLPVGVVEVTIDPTSGATVVVSGPGDPYVFSGSGGSQELAPGVYTWDATASPGFALTGDDSGAFDIDPCDVSVLVTNGDCQLVDGPLGSVTVFIDADSGATVNVYDAEMNIAASFDGVGGTSNLAPGTYTWVAEPGDGFQFPEGEQTSGEFTIAPCPSTVSVTNGACAFSDGPLGSVLVEIDPASGAVVTIRDADLNIVAVFIGGGGSIEVTPGSYSWIAEAADGFSVTGDTSGEFTIVPCGASVIVTHGNCVAGAPTAFGSVTADIVPEAAANVTVRDQSNVVVAVFGGSGGTQTIPAGEYTWSAEATPGFELTGTTSGAFEVVACDDEVGGIVILPFTGMDSEELLGASILLLGLGIYLIHIARRGEEG